MATLQQVPHPVHFVLNRLQRCDRPVRLFLTTGQAAVVFFEASQKQRLQFLLARYGQQFALGVGPFQLGFLLGRPLPQAVLGPLAAADRLQPLIVPLGVLAEEFVEPLKCRFKTLESCLVNVRLEFSLLLCEVTCGPIVAKHCTAFEWVLSKVFI
jgi:hypothetical protein